MPRVSDEHRASRREQILSAGWRCVARQGFHKTSMADIIRESGLSAGAVYLYFRSKDDIITAIAEQVVAGADQIFDEVLAREAPPTLHEAVWLIVSRIEQIATAGDGELIKVALPVWAEAVRNESIRSVVAQTYRHLRVRMRDLVEAPPGCRKVRPGRRSRAGRPGAVRADARFRPATGCSSATSPRRATRAGWPTSSEAHPSTTGLRRMIVVLADNHADVSGVRVTGGTRRPGWRSPRRGRPRAPAEQVAGASLVEPVRGGRAARRGTGSAAGRPARAPRARGPGRSTSAPAAHAGPRRDRAPGGGTPAAAQIAASSSATGRGSPLVTTSASPWAGRTGRARRRRASTALST